MKRDEVDAERQLRLGHQWDRRHAAQPPSEDASEVSS